MKKSTQIAMVLSAICLMLAVPAQAEVTGHRGNPRVASNRKAWRSSPGYGGRYSTRNSSVAQGLSLSLNALYYYGDIDMLDLAFQHGYQKQNLSLGGSATFAYLHPLANSVNCRISLGGGYLHGNDSARRYTTTDAQGLKVERWIGKGSFRSGFGEAAVGFEWFPFPKAGFYIYAGLGLNVSVIHYDFTKSNRGEGVRVGLLPMLPLEIGYSIDMTHGLFLNAVVAVHQGLLDVPYCNLDAYPVTKSSRFQWGDGYFSVGLTLAYRWNKCEPCRLLRY